MARPLHDGTGMGSGSRIATAALALAVGLAPAAARADAPRGAAEGPGVRLPVVELLPSLRERDRARGLLRHVRLGRHWFERHREVAYGAERVTHGLHGPDRRRTVGVELEIRF